MTSWLAGTPTPRRARRQSNTRRTSASRAHARGGRRTVRRALVALLGLLTLFAAMSLARPRVALAQERRIEQAAKDALKRARADFESNDFDTAGDPAAQGDRGVRHDPLHDRDPAQLHRDLGVMQVKRGDRNGAAQSFAEAAHIDPKVSLGPPFEDDAAVRDEWNASRDESAALAQEQPAGDFETQPPSEQVENTPLPVYVEYVGSPPIASAVAKFRGPGESDWQKVNLGKHGKGWGGVIPCTSVRRGVLRYYVQGFDASGAPVALSGNPKHPFVVPIRRAIASPPPALPGEAPPAKCTATGACPANQPNCNAPPAVSKNEEVPQCEEDSQCSSGVCEDGRCIEKTASGGPRGFARW